MQTIRAWYILSHQALKLTLSISCILNHLHLFYFHGIWHSNAESSKLSLKIFLVNRIYLKIFIRSKKLKLIFLFIIHNQCRLINFDRKFSTFMRTAHLTPIFLTPNTNSNKLICSVQFSIVYFVIFLSQPLFLNAFHYFIVVTGCCYSISLHLFVCRYLSFCCYFVCRIDFFLLFPLHAFLCSTDFSSYVAILDSFYFFIFPVSFQRVHFSVLFHFKYNRSKI